MLGNQARYEPIKHLFIDLAEPLSYLRPLALWRGNRQKGQNVDQNRTTKNQITARFEVAQGRAEQVKAAL